MLIAVGIVPAALAQAKNPFAGEWKANLSKSQRDPNHLFKSVTLRFEISDDVVSITYKGVNMSGNEESGTSKLHPDGKEHPIAEAPGIVEVSRWVGPRLLETVGKKDGKAIGQSTYEISSDGNTLTAKIRGIDASGSTFEQVIVFDRE
jgi:hypothetical protein